jgi:hypothetical protein
MNTFFSVDDSNSWLRRLAFRFIATYLVLFNMPFPLAGSHMKTWMDTAYLKFWQAIVTWVGSHLLQMDHAPLYWLNTDAAGGWIRWVCCLTLSFAVALVWVGFDVRRRHDRAIHELLRVYVRYVLAAAMLAYGLAKVFTTQFPFPTLNTLVLPVGELVPQELLWVFMGYSKPYQVLAGLIEVAGALLLFSRRTTTLGALLLLLAMTNVVMFNLFYDVEVKLYSMHLLLFLFFLLAPDLRRLADLLVFNRPTVSASMQRVWLKPHLVKPAAVLKALFVGWLLCGISAGRLEKAVRVHTNAQPELYGIYDVETVTRDGHLVAPLRTDAKHWRRVVIEDDLLVVRHLDNSSFIGDTMRMDRARGKVTFEISRGLADSIEKLPFSLWPGGTIPVEIAGGPLNAPPAVMDYTRPAPGQVRLDGQLDGAELSLVLRRLDERSLPLVKHRFHWVR